MRSDLGGLLLRLLLWLALLLVAWYCLAPTADGLIGAIASRAIALIASASASHSATASVLEFALSPASSNALIEVSSDVRLYSWGFPLAAALLLAARPPQTLGRLLLVVLAATLVTAWGVTFDVLGKLLREAPFALRHLSSLGANAIALSYQFGALVFPGVIPLTLAIALCWSDLKRSLSFRMTQQ